MSTAFETARDFAAHGYRAFPCHTVVEGRCSCGHADCDDQGKHPRIKRWQFEASTDERVLLHWNDQWPTANWAVVVDTVSVIDMDSKNGADPTELLDQHDLTATVWTGEAPEPDDQHPDSLSGVRGAHVWCQNGVAPGDTQVQGVEIRAGTQYVLIPGSRHFSGVAYEWAGETRPWLELPPVPLALHPPSRPPPEEEKAPKKLRKGKRNTTLYKRGCAMRGAGFDGQEILAALRVFNQNRCEPALKDKDVRKIARSAATQPAGRDERPIAAGWLDGVPMNPLASRTEPLPVVVGFPFLHAGMAAVIAGPTGGGRSMMVEACAYDAAREGLRVLYLGGEITEAEFHDRAADIAERRGHTLDADLIGQIASSRYVDLVETLTAAWRRPERWVQDAARYDVVVIDPLGDALEAVDLEDKNREYRRFYLRLIEPLRNAGPAVLMLDNVGYAEDAQHRPIGPSAKKHKADLVFSCTVQEEPLALRIVARKVRSVRAAFRKDSVWLCEEKTATTRLLEGVFEGVESAPALNTREQVAVRLAVWVVAEGVRCQALRGVTLDTPLCWTLADLARAVGMDPKNKTVRLALADLQALEFMARREDGRWAPTPELIKTAEEER